MDDQRKIFNAKFIRTESKQSDVVYVFDTDKHANVLLHNLNLMQQGEDNHGVMTDVIIKSKDGVDIPFHGALLAAFSPVFEEKLLARCHSNEKNSGIKEQFDADVINCLRDYVYTSTCVLTADNVSSVKQLALSYRLDALVQECQEYEYVCEGDYQADDIEITCGPSPLEILQNLLMLQHAGKLCQTSLEGCEDYVDVKCHGAILAAASYSYVFQEMLGYSKSKDKLTVLPLKDIPIQVLGVFVHYIYTAELFVTGETVQPLLDIAMSYKIPSIAAACCKWLEESIEPDNALGVMWLASQYMAMDSHENGSHCNGSHEKGKVTISDVSEELYTSTKAFVLRNFQEISECDEFLQSTLEELITVVSDDELIIEREEYIFFAMMTWYECDSDNRKSALIHMLQHIRLEHTSMEFLDTVKQIPSMRNNPDYLKIIEDARVIMVGNVHQDESELALLRCSEQFAEASVISSYLDLRRQNEGKPRSSPIQLEGNTKEDSTLGMRYHGKGNRKQLLPTGVNRKGTPVARLKDNRGLYLPKGTNKDGTPNRRTEEFKEATDKSQTARRLNYRSDTESVPARKDGTPDRRFKVNRGGLLRNDGSCDMRFKANKENRPLKEDGSPDMRFRVNKEAAAAANASVISPSAALRNDGWPDMRFKVNKEASPSPSVLAHAPGGLTQKDGKPDVRFKASQQNSQATTTTSSSSQSPLRKDGEPDMRYKIDKETPAKSSGSTPSGPLKKDGTPDMRYRANRSTDGTSSASRPSSALSGYRGSPGASYSSPGSVSSGYLSSPGVTPSDPSKSDGTPDMRYAANKVTQRSSSASRSPSAHSGYSPSSGTRYNSSGSVSSCYSSSPGITPSGPSKSDGTPDMRYAANKVTYGSSSPIRSYSSHSGYSSGSYSSGSSSSATCSYTPSGPSKSDGTPDMRYSANRR